MNVLLIDDESSITDAIQDRLSEFVPGKRFQCFCETDVANNFYYALDYLEVQEPAYDLIISDLLMPGHGLDDILNYDQGTVLTGWFFLYHYILRPDGQYHDKYKNTKIIVFSAYRAELEQYMKMNNLQAFKDRIIFIEKGYIYNDAGGFVKLMQTVESLFTS